MIDVYRYKASDLDGFCPNVEMPHLASDLNARLSRGETILSLAAQGRCVGFCGAVFYSECTAEVWMVLSEDAQEFPVSIPRTLRTLVDALLENAQVSRVQATICNSFSEAHRLIKFLGFKFESELKDFGGTGVPYFMYARTR